MIRIGDGDDPATELSGDGSITDQARSLQGRNCGWHFSYSGQKKSPHYLYAICD